MKNINEKRTFEIEAGLMMSLVTLFILLVSALSASAQKSVVLDAFSKHGIDPGILNPVNVRTPDDYAYDLKQTTVTAGKTNVTVARFDPSGPKEEQWTVVSVDGKSPSKGDINSFRKNKAKPQSSEKTDDASYRIEKETADQLVLSYKPDATSLSKETAFLKDCRLYMTVSLKTRKLEQVQALNEKPVKIAILNADQLDLTIKYVMNEEAKRYFPVNDNLNIQAKFLGQKVNVETVTEYSNYTKK